MPSKKGEPEKKRISIFLSTISLLVRLDLPRLASVRLIAFWMILINNNKKIDQARRYWACLSISVLVVFSDAERTDGRTDGRNGLIGRPLIGSKWIHIIDQHWWKRTNFTLKGNSRIQMQSLKISKTESFEAEAKEKGGEGKRSFWIFFFLLNPIYAIPPALFE